MGPECLKMNTRKLLYSLVMLSSFMFQNELPAKVIYVAPTGHDSAQGTLYDPLRHIQKAIDLAEAGDMVSVQEGIYNESVVIEGKTGLRNAPIAIVGIGRVIVTTDDSLALKNSDARDAYSDLPLSDPSHLYHPYYLGAVFRIHQSDHILIDGIEVQNSEWMGFSARYCDHLTIRNCRSSNTQASGIYVLDCQNVDIFQNEITRACAKINRIGGHGSQECLSIVNTSEFEVHHNVVHESGTWQIVETGGSGVGGEGIDVKEQSSNGVVHHNLVYNLSRLGLYCDAWGSALRNVSFHSNVVHSTLHGMALGCENGGSLENIRIYNNLLYANRSLGIVLSSWGLSGNKSGILIANNTIYKSGVAGIQLGSDLHENIQVLNNILWENGSGNLVKDNFDPGDARAVSAKNNLIAEDPLFVNPARKNFGLNKSSPAIDAGVPVSGIERDLNLAPRISGKSIDIGALEFQE